MLRIQLYMPFEHHRNTQLHVHDHGPKQMKAAPHNSIIQNADTQFVKPCMALSDAPVAGHAEHVHHGGPRPGEFVSPATTTLQQAF